MSQTYIYVKTLVLRLMPKSFLQALKKMHYARRLKKFDGTYQHDLVFMGNLVSSNNEVLDIGANFGIFTYFMSPLVKKIYSYEPVPDTFDILSSNIKKLKLLNVKPTNAAISNKNTTVTMEIPIYSAGGENFYEARIVNGNNQTNHKQVNVKTVTLDEEFADHAEAISLVKCDVEGHELECVEGAKNFLKRSKSAWMIEICSDPDENGTAANKVFETFKALGYQIFWYDQKLLRLRKFGDKSINYFFLLEKHLNILRQRNPTLLQGGL